MQSVCEENDRLKSLSGLDTGSYSTRKNNQLELKRRKLETLQRCSCRLKHSKTYTRIFSESPRFGRMSNSKWKSMIELESTSHHRTCPLFENLGNTTRAKFRIKRSGALLAGAVEASITITRGAGGLSISPALRCAHVVPRDSLLFELVNPRGVYSYRLPTSPSGRSRSMKNSDLESSLEISIRGLVGLFRDGKASPYDVDIEGNTLLHVGLTLFSVRVY